MKITLTEEQRELLLDVVQYMQIRMQERIVDNISVQNIDRVALRFCKRRLQEIEELLAPPP